jgi:hypothetical protein
MSGPQDTRPRNQDGSQAVGVPGIKIKIQKKKNKKSLCFRSFQLNFT